MPTTNRAGPCQESGTPSGSPTWVVWTHVLGTSSVALPGSLAGSCIRSSSCIRDLPGTLTWDVDVASCCATMPALGNSHLPTTCFPSPFTFLPVYSIFSLFIQREICPIFNYFIPVVSFSSFWHQSSLCWIYFLTYKPAVTSLTFKQKTCPTSIPLLCSLATKAFLGCWGRRLSAAIALTKLPLRHSAVCSAPGPSLFLPGVALPTPPVTSVLPAQWQLLCLLNRTGLCWHLTALCSLLCLEQSFLLVAGSIPFCLFPNPLGTHCLSPQPPTQVLTLSVVWRVYAPWSIYPLPVFWSSVSLTTFMIWA